MRRTVLLSTAAGSGAAADDARLDAVVALLQRRARSPLIAVSAHASAVRASHPDLTAIDDSDYAAALAGSELVCISFTARGDAARCARAAHHAAMARSLGVPVAWIAADRDAATPLDADERILAGVESVSATDAETAAALAAVRGRRVEIVAAPELLFESQNGAAARRGRVGVDGEFLDALDGRAFDALRLGLRAYAPRALVVLGGSRRAAALAGGTRVESIAGGWPAWRPALASCEIVVTGDALSIASLALAHAAVPVLAARSPRVLGRVALLDCVVDAIEDPAAWTRALAAAARAERALAARVAPLRALAWRSLGALADAIAPVAPDPNAFDAETRARFARARAELAQPALAAGDGARAERILDAWPDVFVAEPCWAIARARADAVLGSDARALSRLAHAAAANPHDASVHAALARAHTCCGDVAAAAAAWQRCSELQPESAEPWHEVAQLWLLGGRLAAALDAFARAQSCAPGHAASARAIRALFLTEPAREAAFWRPLCAAHPEVGAFARAYAEAAARAGHSGSPPPESAAVAAGPAPGV